MLAEQRQHGLPHQRQAQLQHKEHQPPANEFRVIELRHMHVAKFIGLTCLGNAANQVITYPVALARTLLIAQNGRSEYRGLSHCLRSVLARQGMRGLYSGVWMRSAHVANAALVGATYETVRAAFEPLPKPVRGAIAGACTAMMSQIVLVPTDVVTQHLMLLSSSRLSPVPRASGWLCQVAAVVRWVLRQHGLRGFYKGAAWSVIHFLPHSAVMWSAYSVYCDRLHRLGAWPSRLSVQLVAAPMAGATAGLLLNPIDVLRLRVMIQAKRGAGTREALRRLWTEEGGLRWLGKGMSARLVQSAMFSFLFMLYYEPAKRLALKPEFKDALTW